MSIRSTFRNGLWLSSLMAAALLPATAVAQNYTQNDATYVVATSDQNVLNYVICLERVVGTMPRNMAMEQAVQTAQSACSAASGNVNFSASGTSQVQIAERLARCGFRPREAKSGENCNAGIWGGNNNANPGNPTPSGPVEEVTLTPEIIQTDEGPEGMANDGRWLWVAQSAKRSVAQIDFNARRVTRNVSVGRLPVQMTSDALGRVHVLNHTNQLVMSLEPGRPAQTLMSVGECPENMVTDGTYLLILTLPACSSESSRVVRVDAANGQRAESPVLGEWAQGLTTWGDEVWVGHARHERITIVNKNSLQPEILPVPGIEVWEMTFSADSILAAGRFEGTREDGVIVKFDPQTRQEVARSTIPGFIHSIEADDEHAMVVTGDGVIHVMDVNNLQVMRRITSAIPGGRPSTLLLRNGELLLTTADWNGGANNVMIFAGWKPGTRPTAPRPPQPPQPPANTGPFPLQAASWGGIVRSGPGMQTRRVTSLNEREPITLLRNTGVIMNGYPWFEIAYRGGNRGFQWGGIICWNSQPVDGVEGQCRNMNQGNNTNTNTRTNNGATKAAVCYSSQYGQYACRFEGVFGDGSFVITANGKDTFQLNMAGPGQGDGFITVGNDRPVSLPGLYIRQSDDPACWQNDQTSDRVCVW